MGLHTIGVNQTKSTEGYPLQTILIIEDDQAIRETWQLVLEIEGYFVVTAVNGREGLKMLQSSNLPCLILLDLSMPVMNGFEFLEAMRKDYRIASIPVLITSAEAELAKFEKVAGILEKPVQLETLLDFVGRYCSKENNFSTEDKVS